jgi:hypothetical protein
VQRHTSARLGCQEESWPGAVDYIEVYDLVMIAHPEKHTFGRRCSQGLQVRTSEVAKRRLARRKRPEFHKPEPQPEPRCGRILSEESASGKVGRNAVGRAAMQTDTLAELTRGQVAIDR